MSNAVQLLLHNLPALIAFLQNLQHKMQARENEKAVEDDMAKIIKAFEDRDEKALRDVFDNE